MSRSSRASVYPDTGRTQWIISQRPPRTIRDPYKPHGFFLEEERSESGDIVSSGTILLTNKECPWHCLMCDLWKTTLTQKVPPGAIPRQIEHALHAFAFEPQQIKLYNGGSFFDPAAIPCGDYADIAARVSFARNVVVESHPRLIGKHTRQFHDWLQGSLEVGMGLETVHPQILPRLNKNFSLEDFSTASRQLRREGVGVRAFVLVKAPFMDEAEGIEWAVKSAEFAFEHGANVVSLIPTRAGNGAMERLQDNGEFSPPRLETLERAFEICVRLGAGRVFADTWNLELFSSCAACLNERRNRLHQMNLTQKILPTMVCPACRNGAAT